MDLNVMAYKNTNNEETLAQEIQRRSSTSENRRFLTAMDLFQVDWTLPDTMRELLGRIDLADRTRQTQAGGR